MTPDSIQEHLRLAAVTAAVDSDRRRPGRGAVSAELVHLLRTADKDLAAGSDQSFLVDENINSGALHADAKLSASSRQGLVVGLLLAPLWMIIGALVFAILK